MSELEELLSSYRWLAMEERQIRDRVEEIGGYGCHAGNGEKKTRKPIEECAVALLEAIDMMKEKHSDLLKRMIRIEEIIGWVDRSDYRFILREYYVNGSTWEEVADKSNYSIRSIMRLKKKAIDDLYKKYYGSDDVGN